MNKLNVSTLHELKKLPFKDINIAWPRKNDVGVGSDYPSSIYKWYNGLDAPW